MSKIVGLTFEAPREEHTCPVCGKVYKTREGLDKHIEKEHPVREPHPEE